MSNTTHFFVQMMSRDVGWRSNPHVWVCLWRGKGSGRSKSCGKIEGTSKLVLKCASSNVPQLRVGYNPATHHYHPALETLDRTPYCKLGLRDGQLSHPCLTLYAKKGSPHIQSHQTYPGWPASPSLGTSGWEPKKNWRQIQATSLAECFASRFARYGWVSLRNLPG